MYLWLYREAGEGGQLYRYLCEPIANAGDRINMAMGVASLRIVVISPSALPAPRTVLVMAIGRGTPWSAINIKDVL